MKIRLMGIDAPEKNQAWGKSSTQALAGLVEDKEVTAECPKKDKYQRWLCKLIVNGEDVNLKMVETGNAWHYKQYQSDQSALDRVLYSRAEESAASRKDGLWHGEPMPPWDFRRLK